MAFFDSIFVICKYFAWSYESVMALDWPVFMEIQDYLSRQADRIEEKKRELEQKQRVDSKFKRAFGKR